MRPHAVVVLLLVLPLPAMTLRRVHVKFEMPTTETLLPNQEEAMVMNQNYDPQAYHLVKVGSNAKLFPRRFVKTLPTTTTPVPPTPSTFEPLRCEDIAAMAERYGIKDIPAFASQNCFLIRMYMSHVTCEEINLVVNYCFANNNQNFRSL